MDRQLETTIRERPELKKDLMREAYRYNQQIDDMNELRRSGINHKKFSKYVSWIGMGSLVILTGGGLLMEGITGNKIPWADISGAGLIGYFMGMIPSGISLYKSNRVREKVRELELS